MGRPIQKAKMQPIGDTGPTGTSGRLAVTAYRPYGGAKVDSTTAYIVNQRGSKKFKIHLEDSSEEVMLLKAVAPASLANDNVNGLGEFCVQVILDDSTVAYVEKFYNNTIHYVEADGTTTGTVKYTLGSEGTDEGAVANLGSIDVI
jgi:hypothetical protein